MTPARPRRRAPKKPWWRTAEGIRTIGLLCTTVFGAWASSQSSQKVARELNSETQQEVKVVAQASRTRVGRVDSLRAEVERLRGRVAVLEKRAAARPRIIAGGFEGPPPPEEPYGPPAPAPRWGIVRKFVGGIFRPFKGG